MLGININLATTKLLIQVADGDEPLPSDDSRSRAVSIQDCSLVFLDSTGFLTPMQDILAL